MTVHPSKTSNVYDSKKRLPRTKGLPIVGSVPELLKSPFSFLVEAREKYGDIYMLDLGVLQTLVLNHPRHAQHLLVDHTHNYGRGGGMWDSLRGLLGNGIIVSENESWLRQRRMMQPQFHRRRLSGLTHLMVSAVDETLDGWDAMAASAAPFNIASAFNHLTMNVLVRSLFGAALTATEMKEVAGAMTVALDHMMWGMLSNTIPTWMSVPGTQRYRQALVTFNEVMFRIIAACRASEGGEHHLLAMLLDVTDAETGEHMSDQQVRDEVASLFLAGYETTSITLAWAIDYLMRRPEVLRKLQAEVDSVLGERPPTFEDLSRLEYTRMVLQETLRLRPPAWWFLRETIANDEIDGYSIPAGTHVIFLPYVCHRHPDEWPNPEHFDPERFTIERSTNRHKFAWIPFGAGQRVCMGRDFAMIEGQLALAMIVQRYLFSPVSQRPVQPQLTSMHRPKDGVSIKLAKRR